MSALSFQIQPAAASVNTTLYAPIQNQLCARTPGYSSVVSVYLSSKPDCKVAPTTSQIARSVLDAAVGGMTRVFSSVGRVFTQIDAAIPLIPVTYAQVVNPSSADVDREEPTGPHGTVGKQKVSEPADKPLTIEEQIFMRDVEICIGLIAEKKSHYPSYLRKLNETISAYMDSYKIQAFPAHMSRVTELLTYNLTDSQFRDLTEPNERAQPFPENCFYNQLNDAVESVKMILELNNKKITALRRVQIIQDVYLASIDSTLFPQHIGKIVDQIINKLGHYERQLLVDTLPILIENESKE